MCFSIVVTAYNYEDFVLECVESCLNQNTKVGYEVIVVNDGSTDGTGRELKMISNEKLKVYTIGNSGIEAASNFGFLKSHGDYLVRVDADDSLHPNFLKVMDEHIRGSDAHFFYANYFIMDSNSEVTSEMELPGFNVDEIFSRGDFLATGTILRKSNLADVGYYSESVKNCGLENYELILKLLAAGNKGLRVDSKLFYYRKHGLNLSEVNRDRIIDYGKQLFDRLDLGRFRTNKFHPYQLML